MFTSILLAVVAVIAIALLFVFLSVGLVLVIAVVFIALVVGAVAFVINGGTSFLGTGKGDAVVQSFYNCLLTEVPETCRSKFTTWGDTEKGFVEGLAAQAKKDLGKRDEDSVSRHNFESHTNNGVSEIKMDLVTDFEHHKDVKEHYLVVGDGDDLRIKEVAWEY